MGSFTRYPESFRDSVTTLKWGTLWVFIPQQFHQRMKSVLGPSSDTLLRVRQLLGLPPENVNTYFVELWVPSQDLFRPAGDPEINDEEAGLYLSKTVDSTYSSWYYRSIYDLYFSSSRHYPWTRLGYTYDWADGASEIGLSEFCIKSNSVIRVKAVYPWKTYFR
jgi:hypothetical protein